MNHNLSVRKNLAIVAEILRFEVYSGQQHWQWALTRNYAASATEVRKVIFDDLRVLMFAFISLGKMRYSGE